MPVLLEHDPRQYLLGKLVQSVQARFLVVHKNDSIFECGHLIFRDIAPKEFSSHQRRQSSGFNGIAHIAAEHGHCSVSIDSLPTVFFGEKIVDGLRRDRALQFSLWILLIPRSLAPIPASRKLMGRLSASGRSRALTSSRDFPNLLTRCDIGFS